MCDKEVEKLIKQLMKVRLELDPLLKKKASLEELLKEHPGVHETGNVKVTIKDSIRKVVDWAKVKVKYKITQSALAKYTEEKSIRSLKISVK